MMDDIPSFDEQKEVISDTLDTGLQVRMLGREIGDGEWLEDDVRSAHRVTILAALIFALKGSYADFGINEWFLRPRQALNGLAPVDILRENWSADQFEVQTIMKLARFHIGPSAPDGPSVH
jgi:hypothetical protein